VFFIRETMGRFQGKRTPRQVPSVSFKTSTVRGKGYRRHPRTLVLRLRGPSFGVGFEDGRGGAAGFDEPSKRTHTKVRAVTGKMMIAQVEGRPMA